MKARSNPKTTVRQYRSPAVGGAARLVGVLLLLVVGCSSSTQAESSDETLDRLRERIEEAEATQAEEAIQGEEESAVAQAQTQAEEPETVPSLLLEPRYHGALPDGHPLVLGVFPFRENPHPIIDGDTVAVVGLDASLRLFGIDTEEKFRGHPERRARAYSDFDDYLNEIYAEADGPFPKFGTPMGELAREFAIQFFAGDTEVRLELDDLNRTRGYYNRYLVYVFAMRDGEWVNYNIEAVRAGMTPYFPKYGRSERFHQRFLEAEQEARDNRRGIWNPDLRHYPDYEGRLEWWHRRGDAIAYFHEHYGDNEDYFEVGADDDWTRLTDPSNEYREIILFGTLGNFHMDYTPPRVMVSHRLQDDFSLIAWREGTFARYDLESFAGEYVYIRGQLRFHEGRPQFVLDNGIRIWTEP